MFKVQSFGRILLVPFCASSWHRSRFRVHGSRFKVSIPSVTSKPKMNRDDETGPADLHRPATCNLQPATFNTALPSTASQHSNTLSHAAVRTRLIRCLKSRVNEPDWQWLLDRTEYFAYVELH